MDWGQGEKQMADEQLKDTILKLEHLLRKMWERCERTGNWELMRKAEALLDAAIADQEGGDNGRKKASHARKEEV
jgi:hypothetical protein